jgi:hypothetical protein
MNFSLKAVLACLASIATSGMRHQNQQLSPTHNVGLLFATNRTTVWLFVARAYRENVRIEGIIRPLSSLATVV